MIPKKYFVYRYLDKDNNIIYVGLTARPLKHRVREHMVEELNNETVKIQYIIVPNESQMHQREWYYIDAYKPKYNKRDVHSGKPEIMPEYDAKWIDYPKGNDIKQVEWIIDTLMDTFFENEKFTYFVSLSNKRDMIGVCSERFLLENGNIKNEIVVGELDLINNDKRMLIDILSQIVQIIIKPKGVRASNREIYINNRVAYWLHKYGIKTEKSKYGNEPVNCDEKYINELSMYEYGTGDIKLYTPVVNKKSSSTVKYIDKRTGNSVRATKKHILFCLDDKPDVAIEICKKYGISQMVLE